MRRSPGTLGFQVVDASGGNSILDTGFFLTQPLYDLLKSRQWLNDLLALANSLSLAVGVICELIGWTLRIGDGGGGGGGDGEVSSQSGL